MLRIVNRIFTRSKTSGPLLGRWDQNTSAEIKSILANYDNCGDSICKDPKEVSKFIDDEVKKIQEEKKKMSKSNNTN